MESEIFKEDSVSSVEIVNVRNGRELRDFIRLPWSIYRGNPYWVPPLIIDVQKLLNKQKNPYQLKNSRLQAPALIGCDDKGKWA